MWIVSWRGQPDHQATFRHHSPTPSPPIPPPSSSLPLSLPSRPKHVVPVLEAVRRILDLNGAPGHAVGLQGARSADLTGDIVVGEQHETGHSIGDSDLVQPFTAERGPDRNAEQDHRRKSGLHALRQAEDRCCGGQHDGRTVRATERHPGIGQIARASGIIPVEEGTLDRDEAPLVMKAAIVQSGDHRGTEVDLIALAKRCPGMEAQRARQQCNAPSTQIGLGGCPDDRSRLIPNSYCLLAPPQVCRHSRRRSMLAVSIVEGMLLDAQNLVDDIAGIATCKAFEEQCMIANANGKARATVSMSGAPAHGAARLPFASEALDDIGTDCLELRVKSAGGEGHGQFLRQGRLTLASGGFIGRIEPTSDIGRSLEERPEDRPTPPSPLPSQRHLGPRDRSVRRVRNGRHGYP